MLEAGLITLAIAFPAVGLLWVLPAYRRHNGKWIVTCPETSVTAGVEIDTARVAATAWFGQPDLRVKGCSQWPEEAACGRGCRDGIERETKAAKAGRYRCESCVLCGRPIPGALADVSSTQKPVCWDCHIALSVARARPDLPVLPERTQAFG